MKNISNKLALGTAQFGMNYGITNKAGKIKLASASSIIQFARESGIDTIDTASAYGDSETLIGEISVTDFKCVSKLPPIPRHQVQASLNKIRVSSLYALLIHRIEDIFSINGIKLLHSLYKMKSKGIIKKIGVSLYKSSEIEKLINFLEIDIIQIPLNIIDQRMIINGCVKKLFENNIEIHIRSIFLQGILLAKKENRPPMFNKWKNLWKIWHEWLNDNNITALEATVRFAHSINEISKAIVGIENKRQLQQIIIASKGKIPAIPRELFVNDENLLNPSLWTNK
jgi:aryl-alcohol dehydrogenase-like predicted oxidoreductase